MYQQKSNSTGIIILLLFFVSCGVLLCSSVIIGLYLYLSRDITCETVATNPNFCTGGVAEFTTTPGNTKCMSEPCLESECCGVTPRVGTNSWSDWAYGTGQYEPTGGPSDSTYSYWNNWARGAVDIDCEGTWSNCTTACESADQRTWTETIPRSGNGARCPESVHCAINEGSCTTGQDLCPTGGCATGHSCQDKTWRISTCELDAVVSYPTCGGHDCSTHANDLHASPDSVTCMATQCTDTECCTVSSAR